MKKSRINILLVEDNPADTRLIKENLVESRHPFKLTHVGRLSTALRRLAAGDIDVVLLDLVLPDSQKEDTFFRIQQASDVPIVVLTGLQDEELGLKLVHVGAQDYLVKGQVTGSLLANSIRYAIERKRILDELDETRRQQLEMKDRFLSHVSHELRSPLAAIHQFVTILLDGLAGEISSEQQRNLEIILRNVNQLKTMIDDLLDVTRAETGRLTLQPKCISLKDPILESYGTLRARAAQKGIFLSTNVPNDLPAVYADPARVYQILTNLIDNGIKFTPEKGTITVEARVFDEDPNLVCVTVSDTGYGIPPEEKEKIFEYLYQGKNPLEASRKGLGLGLFICREFVSRHGGQIWVQSQLGRGSTFFFTLPIFSSRGLLAPILTPKTLMEGAIGLIAVEVLTSQVSLRAIEERTLQEVWNVLNRCLRPGLDVLLPRMFHNGTKETFFCVISCNNPGRGEANVQRIKEQLVHSRELQDAELSPLISFTIVDIPEGRGNMHWEQRIKEVTNGIDEAIKKTIEKGGII